MQEFELRWTQVSLMQDKLDHMAQANGNLTKVVQEQAAKLVLLETRVRFLENSSEVRSFGTWSCWFVLWGASVHGSWYAVFVLTHVFRFPNLKLQFTILIWCKWFMYDERQLIDGVELVRQLVPFLIVLFENCFCNFFGKCLKNVWKLKICKGFTFFFSRHLHVMSVFLYSRYMISLLCHAKKCLVWLQLQLCGML